MRNTTPQNTHSITKQHNGTYQEKTQQATTDEATTNTTIHAKQTPNKRSKDQASRKRSTTKQKQNTTTRTQNTKTKTKTKTITDKAAPRSQARIDGDGQELKQL